MEISQVSVKPYVPAVPDDSVVAKNQAQDAAKVSSASAILASKAASSMTDAQSSANSLQQAVDEINETVRMLDRNLKFTVDRDTGIDVIKVVDTSTEDVIRQIPSKEVLAIAKALDQLKGLILRDKA